MSEPTADPTAVILARMEVKLDNALDQQKRHSTTLDRHESTLVQHGNRLTALETRETEAAANTSRTISARAVIWSAVGGVAAIAMVMVYVYMATKP